MESPYRSQAPLPLRRRAKRFRASTRAWLFLVFLSMAVLGAACVIGGSRRPGGVAVVCTANGDACALDIDCCCIARR